MATGCSCNQAGSSEAAEDESYHDNNNDHVERDTIRPLNGSGQVGDCAGRGSTSGDTVRAENLNETRSQHLGDTFQFQDNDAYGMELEGIQINEYENVAQDL